MGRLLIPPLTKRRKMRDGINLFSFLDSFLFGREFFVFEKPSSQPSPEGGGAKKKNAVNYLRKRSAFPLKHQN